MASQVILKKSSVAERVPVVGDLAYGELALNYADGLLYFKKSDGINIGIIGNASGTNTGDETAATIKTKLGITTLSGSNTGDQVLPTLSSLSGQPLDADLTAIAALVGTSGLLKKTAANTWSLDTTAYTTNLGTVTGVTGTAPVVSSGGITPVISMAAATTSVSGYLTSTDWNTFNGKQAAGTYATGTGSASGANTGDETTATIKTKLGITTLSGSNTGDQTIPTTLPNANAITFNSSGGAAAGSTYTGAAVLTVDYATVGAAAAGHTHSYQAADADLLAIGGLTGTNGLLKKTAADTWTLDTTAYTTNTGTVTSVATSGGYGGLTLTGGTITTTGTITMGGTPTGTWPISVSGSSTSTPLVSIDSSIAYGRSGLQYFNVNNLAGDVATTTNTPTADWWHIIRGNHANVSGYYTDLALPMTAATNIRYRRISGGVSSGWITVWDSTNLTNLNQLTNGPGYVTSSGVTSVGATAPVASSGGTAPVISMAAATTSVNGYLTSTDWNTFNGKQAAGLSLLLAGGTMTGLITGGRTAGALGLDFATNDNYASMRVISNAKPLSDGMFIGYGNTNSGITRIRGGGATGGGIDVNGSGTNDVTINGSIALNAGNYNSYSPTLTGGSASGTWGISITGNAANITAYTINQSVGTGNGVTFAEVYSNGWLRNNNNNTGLYNSANGNHFYSRAGNRWGITGNSAASSIYLDFYATHENTIRGSVHADTVNNIGFLTPSGGWSFMVSSGGNATATGTITGTNLSGTNTGDNAGVTSVSGTAPVVSSGGTAPAISMAAATTSVDGYLTAANWTTFNNKAPTASPTFTGRITGATGTGSANGFGFDSDTGMTSTGDGNLKFYTNNVYAGGPNAGTNNWDINITGSATNTSSISSAVGSGYTWTGVQSFQSNLGTTSGALNSPPLQVYATGTNSAFMSFHRGGAYAVNMGLDSDNVFRIGGWSAAANRLQMDMSGNLTMAGTLAGSNLSGTNTGDNAGVTSVSGTAPVVSSGGTTPAISMAAASASVNGYLTSANWTTFNGKQDALGFTPYNSTNPSGYITSSALASYLPLSGGTVSGVVRINNTLQAGQNTNGTAIVDAASGIAYFGCNSAGNGITVFSNGNFGSPYNLDFVNGSATVRIHMPGGTASNYNTGISAGWTVHSDYRLKENVAPLMGALQKVFALKPVTFSWIGEASQTMTGGFLAHELSEQVPYAVMGEKDAVNGAGEIVSQAADYSKVVPLLTAAIQEQQVLIEALTARLSALESAPVPVV